MPYDKILPARKTYPLIPIMAVPWAPLFLARQIRIQKLYIHAYFAVKQLENTQKMQYNINMNLAIVCNTDKPDTAMVAEHIVAWCNQNNVRCHKVLQAVDIEKDSDFLVVLGGDGTILSWSHAAVERRLPVLAFNTGRVGFLAQDSGDIDAVLRAVAQGDYTLRRRRMLRVAAGRQVRWGLNDVSVNRDGTILRIAAYKREQCVCRMRGDGMIVATATGATAYSLSCGGPIADPDWDGLLLTPVCAHSLASRPMVFGADTELRIVAEGATGGTLYVDGDSAVRFTDKLQYSVRLSRKYVSFVKVGEDMFYRTLQSKLTERS